MSAIAKTLDMDSIVATHF